MVERRCAIIILVLPSIKISKDYRKKKLNLGVTEIILPICSLGKYSASKKNTIMQARFAQNIISQIDVLNFYKKFNSFDKIMFILTKEKQKFLIENCANPYIEDKAIPADWKFSI